MDRILVSFKVQLERCSLNFVLVAMFLNLRKYIDESSYYFQDGEKERVLKNQNYNKKTHLAFI